MREAQAMAALTHPNVVAIHDVEVGADEEGVTMVMEYVAGPTLRQWLREGEHAWAEVVAALVQAGHGLAAAHRVGLVHRDFKPGNVLVAEEDRIKVTDFGLARRAWSVSDDELGGRDGPVSPTTDPFASSDSVSIAPGDDALTRGDVVLGTPPYMAPEQHQGRPPDARADQYAFCVSLWVGLNRVTPFRGRLEQMFKAKLAGPPAWPKGSDVPTRIVAAITRGLAPKPEDRWPSMEALLEALAYDPAARRRRVAWTVAGLSGAAALVAVALWTRPAAESPCSEAQAQLSGIWDPTRRAEVEASLLGTSVPFAPATAERVRAHLDAYAGAWTDAGRSSARPG